MPHRSGRRSGEQLLKAGQKFGIVIVFLHARPVHPRIHRKEFERFGRSGRRHVENTRRATYRLPCVPRLPGSPQSRCALSLPVRANTRCRGRWRQYGHSCRTARESDSSIKPLAGAQTTGSRCKYLPRLFLHLFVGKKLIQPVNPVP